MKKCERTKSTVEAWINLNFFTCSTKILFFQFILFGNWLQTMICFPEKTFRLHFYLMKQIDWKFVCVANMIDILNDAFCFTKEIITKPPYFNFFRKKHRTNDGLLRYAQMVIKDCFLKGWPPLPRTDHPVTEAIFAGICGGGGCNHLLACNIKFLKTISKFKISIRNE